MLLEKSAGLTQHPQAHYINNRTMEASAWSCVCNCKAAHCCSQLCMSRDRVLNCWLAANSAPCARCLCFFTCIYVQVFRSVPGLSQQVSALNPPLDEWRRFIYCESMVTGQLLGEVDHFPGD